MVFSSGDGRSAGHDLLCVMWRLLCRFISIFVAYAMTVYGKCCGISACLSCSVSSLSWLKKWFGMQRSHKTATSCCCSLNIDWSKGWLVGSRHPLMCHFDPVIARFVCTDYCRGHGHVAMQSVFFADFPLSYVISVTDSKPCCCRKYGMLVVSLSSHVERVWISRGFISRAFKLSQFQYTTGYYSVLLG